jgi:tetratricopeptide (TPR) repeat protein
MRNIWLSICLSGAAFAQTQPSQPAAGTYQTAAATNVRPPLTAQSQDEFEAYQKVASEPNLVRADAAAQDFAIRFPDSDLRAAIFQSLMLKHQAANEAPASLADAERVLLIDPQNVVALVSSANILSERTPPGKPESPQRFEQALRFAERAIANLENGFAPPARATPEDAAKYRATLLSVAHAAAGNVYLLQSDYAAAEKELIAATNLDPNNALALYRLAVTQHEQRRYGEALVTVDKAVTAANAANDLMLAQRAKQEQNALAKAVAHR